MNEFAQLPTPMIATRTFSCCRSRPLPFVSLTVSLHQLLADVQDPLADGDPGCCGEEHERPGEHAPRCEHEPCGDDDDALGSRADAHVAAETECLGLGACVRDEERPRDCAHRNGDEYGVVVT